MRLSSIIVGIVLGILFGYIYTVVFPSTITVVETKVEYKYKTITETKYLDRLKVVSVVLPSYDSIVIPKDYDSLVKSYTSLWYKYNTKKLFNDTLQIDSLGTVSISQEVYKNNITNFKYSYSLTLPEKVTTNIVTTKNNLYIGGLVGKELIAPCITYSYDGKYNFSLGYNAVNNGFLLGITYKIK